MNVQKIEGQDALQSRASMEMLLPAMDWWQVCQLRTRCPDALDFSKASFPRKPRIQPQSTRRAIASLWRDAELLNWSRVNGAEDRVFTLTGASEPASFARGTKASIAAPIIGDHLLLR